MIALLGDLHFGCHGSQVAHHEYMAKFFKDFWKYIDDRGIEHIVQLGDMFDVRKHINTWSLSFFRKNFLMPALERDVSVTVLIGNHDIFYRESLEVSSVEEVLMQYNETFTLVKEPGDYMIGDTSFLCIPWVCKENALDVEKAINESKSQYCVGHFEFDGFELFRGHYAKSHQKHTILSKFKQVFSGHYHHMSSKDNVLYTGTPYQLTWQDADTTKGFFVLEEDESLTLVETAHTIYSNVVVSEHQLLTEDLITGKHVKLKIDTVLEPKDRESLIDNVYSLKPLTLKIIEPSVLDVKAGQMQVVNADVDIADIIGDYVSAITVSQNIDKDRLKSILFDLHSMAINES
jgi:DNA repair exonuclease SbcCD nuclease subunit